MDKTQEGAALSRTALEIELVSLPDDAAAEDTSATSATEQIPSQAWNLERGNKCRGGANLEPDFEFQAGHRNWSQAQNLERGTKPRAMHPNLKLNLEPGIKL